MAVGEQKRKLDAVDVGRKKVIKLEDELFIAI